MKIDQPTLVQFENIRKMNSEIPPGGANSFYNVGPGKINLFTIRDDPDNYRFDITIDHGNVYTGAGNFIISGDIINIDNPYRNLIVTSESILTVNQFLTVQGGISNIYGKLELLPNSQLRIYGGDAILHSNSVLIVNDKTNLSVAPGSTLTIYGRVDVHISVIDSILNAPGVIMDSAAVLNVNGIENAKDRPFSLTDYDTELRERFVNVDTQGERIYNGGRLGYLWRQGSPKEPSQALGIILQIGEITLGDFRFPLLGKAVKMIPQLQILSDLHIKKETTLHITEKFNNSTFIRPELYIGAIIGNSKQSADCLIDGKIIADGINCSIIVDRGGRLRISETGELRLKNGAPLRSTNNLGIEVLSIDGKLIIDDISQIESFSEENIIIGPKGKIIILNPKSETKRLLFTTPNGIIESTLYRLFRHRIDSVEYHISENCGIGIDKFFDNYSRDMTKWYGDRRFEKAIHDGILKWHKGAYIEIYTEITPFIDENSTLLSVGHLFKSFGSYDKDRLQDLVDRLRYAGCSDVIFRFINGDKIKEVTLVIEECNMKHVLNNPIGDRYLLHTDNMGELFIRNRISDTTIKSIISPISKRYEIPVEKIIEFTLP